MITILKKIATEIAAGFPSLQLWGQIYLVPTIVPSVPGLNNLEIQIALGSSLYNDQSGSILSENFQVDIGIIRRNNLDVHNLNRMALIQATENILADRATLRPIINGNYLGSLITRPMIITSESGVLTTKESMYKILTFVGGLNANWGS